MGGAEEAMAVGTSAGRWGGPDAIWRGSLCRREWRLVVMATVAG